MKRTLARASCAGLLAVLLSTGAGLAILGSAFVPTSETTSVSLAATATPTYVSELAPAVVVQPRQAAALPDSGAGPDATPANPLPRAAGWALVLLGGLLLRTGLTWRSSTNR